MLIRLRWMCSVLLLLPALGPVAAADNAAFARTKDTTFLCHFDGPALKADVAAGNSVSRSKETPEFVDGKSGKAVSLAGPGIDFDAAKNIDMRRGTIDIRFMDLDWNRKFVKQKRYLLSMSGGSKGNAWYFDVLLLGGLCYYRIYMYPDPATKKGHAYHPIHMGDARVSRVGKWTHVRIGWDCDKLGMWAIMDDEYARTHTFEPVDGANPMARLHKFPPRVIRLGAGRDSMVVIDDLRIRDRVDPDDFVPRALRHDDATNHGARVSRNWKPSFAVESPHIKWAKPYSGGKTKVLVVQPWVNLRETVELWQRFDCEIDVIPVTSVERRCDKTKGMFPYEREDFLKKIKAADVVILGGIPPQWFSDDAWKALLDAVASGKGLVWTIAHMKFPRVKELDPKKANLPDYLQRGPSSRYSPMLTRSELFATAHRGKGRIVFWDCATHLFTRYSSMTPIYYEGHGEYYYALMARLALWAGRREPAMTADVVRPEIHQAPLAPAENIECVVTLPPGSPERTCRVDFVVRDTSIGRTFKPPKGTEGYRNVRPIGRWTYPELHRTSRRLALKAGANKMTFSAPGLPGGWYAFDLHVRDEAGRVIDWDTAMVVVRPQPRLVLLDMVQPAYLDGGTAAAELTFDRLPSGAVTRTLDWQLTDLYGRVLVRGSSPWSGKAKQRIEVPVRRVVSKGVSLNVSLKRDGKLVQKHSTSFLVPRRKQKAFYYAIYGARSRIGELKVDTLVSTGEKALIENDVAAFHWLGVPGLRVDAHKDAVRKPCLTSPEWRAQVEKYFERYGPIIARQKPIAGVVVDEWEYAHWRHRGGHDLCHSPTCMAGFREFLKKDYANSLAGLNASWGTQYAQWDDVEMKLTKDVDTKGRPAAVVDRLRFNESVVADALGFINDVARKYDPGCRLGLSGTRPARGFNGYDYWKLMQGRAGAIANYGGAMPMQSLTMKKPGDFVTQWQGYGSNFRPTAAESFWRLFVTGTDGFTNYATYPQRGPRYVDWILTPGTAAFAKAFAEIDKGIAELVRGGRRVSDGVAIHYSQSSVHAFALGLVPGVTEKNFYANMTGLIRLLEDSGIEARFVSYDQIEKGELVKQRCRALIMPLSSALSDAEARGIKAFAEAGGTVIADAMCGMFDRHCNRRERPALDDFFGIKRTAPRLEDRLGGLALSDAFPNKALAGKTVSAMFAEAGVVATVGKALGGISLGKHKNVPALVLREHGKGASVYANMVVSDYNVVTGGGVGGEIATITRAKARRRAEAKSLLLALLATAGVTPAVRIDHVTPPEKGHLEVLSARYRDGDALYVLLLPRYAGAFKLEDRLQNDVIIRLPHAAHVYELRSGEYLGRTDTLKRRIIENEPLFLAMLPHQVKGISVACDPKNYAPGDRVAYNLSATPLRHVAYIRVFGPDGEVRPAYAAKVDCRAGTGKASFPLALNDSAGTWRIIARDVASGAEASAAFTVAAPTP